jgi:hypothetical protein
MLIVTTTKISVFGTEYSRIQPATHMIQQIRAVVQTHPACAPTGVSRQPASGSAFVFFSSSSSISLAVAGAAELRKQLVF